MVRLGMTKRSPSAKSSKLGGIEVGHGWFPAALRFMRIAAVLLRQHGPSFRVWSFGPSRMTLEGIPD
jgi:hypothetical protein